MAAIAALDAKTDLAGVVLGGVIREDIMQAIWNISSIPLPFTDVIGQGSVNAAQYDWVVDKLAAAAQNKWVETAFMSTTTQTVPTDFADTATPPTGSGTNVGARLRNYIQISVKAISVSEMSEAVASVGGSGGLEYNLMQAQQELMRDMEFCMLGNFATVIGDGSVTAPVTAGYAAAVQDQLVPTRDLANVGAAGVQGGWSSGASGFLAYTPGTARAMTETFLRNMAQDLYIGGCGGPDQRLVAMAAPALKRTISQYMYTSSARIAQLVQDVGKTSQATAQGSVEIFITDFGTLELVPNRFMGDLGTNQFGVYVFDPNYFEKVYLRGPTTTAASKIGLVDRRIVNAYWGTRFNPECIGAVLDINPALTMTA